MRSWGSRGRMPAYVLRKGQHPTVDIATATDGDEDCRIIDSTLAAAEDAGTAAANAVADHGNEEWCWSKRLKLGDGVGNVLSKPPISFFSRYKSDYGEFGDGVRSNTDSGGSLLLMPFSETSSKIASQRCDAVKSKTVVRHFLFKRPVAIKSKNCLEVVKKKTVRFKSPADADTPLLNNSSDQRLHGQEIRSEQNGEQKQEQSVAEVLVEEALKDENARSLVRHILKQFDQLRRTLQGGLSGKRADLKAGTIIKRRNLRINQKKRVGSVPGIEVGDQFSFRIEMLLVGLHRQVQAGIDFITAKESRFNEPVAVSVVASVGHSDYYLHGGETLIYKGQGGNPHKDDKAQEDQKLVRGNLALKNSHKLKLPVRVIRCYDRKAENSDKLYTYDGLYQVEKVWKERATSGCFVYKFCLQRLSGQAPLRSTFGSLAGFRIK